MKNEASETAEEIVSEAVEVWKGAQLVNMSPVWKGRPRGRCLAEALAARKDCEEVLVKFLSHENELMVAYSLVALEMMGSSTLEDLPENLLERKQLITELRGSFGIELELGQFAREIQSRWLEAQL